MDRAAHQTVQQQPGGLRGLSSAAEPQSVFAACRPSASQPQRLSAASLSVVSGSDGRRQLVAHADPHQVPQSDRQTGESCSGSAPLQAGRHVRCSTTEQYFEMSLVCLAKLQCEAFSVPPHTWLPFSFVTKRGGNAAIRAAIRWMLQSRHFYQTWTKFPR